MARNSDALIAELVGELEPVRPLRFGEGLALALAAAGVSAVVVAGLYGLRADWLAGHVNPMHLVATGLFLGLALAAAVTVMVMSRPQVGSDHSGWRWAAAMAALLPLAGVIVAMSRSAAAMSYESMASGAECFAAGSAASLLVFAMLVWWLRRPRPIAPGWSQAWPQEPSGSSPSRSTARIMTSSISASGTAQRCWRWRGWAVCWCRD